MKFLIITITLLLFCTGCAQFTGAQMQLVDQAQRGLDLCRSAQEERSQLVDQLHQVQRGRLDSAFDADVRARADIDADWIIEHRRAYATAVEMLHRQRTASREADAVTARNFAAISEALNRLRTLQELQSQLASPTWWLGSNPPPTP